MLDLNHLPHSSSGQLVRVFPKRSSDDKGLFWDWDFAYSIGAENLPAIEGVFCGVSQMITNAESAGTSTTLRDTTERDPVHLTITRPDVDGMEQTLFHGQAEIRFVRLVVTGKLVVATIRFRTRGLAENAAALISQLGDHVMTAVTAQQMSLDFDKKEDDEPAKTPAEPKKQKKAKATSTRDVPRAADAEN
jgi:hypothetical protein